MAIIVPGYHGSPLSTPTVDEAWARIQLIEATCRIAGFRPLPGQASQAYHWPQVRDRSKPAHEMRSGPRASKWDDLEKT
mgnify:CR=1 FL=1